MGKVHEHEEEVSDFEEATENDQVHFLTSTGCDTRPQLGRRKVICHSILNHPNETIFSFNNSE